MNIKTKALASLWQAGSRCSIFKEPKSSGQALLQLHTNYNILVKVTAFETEETLALRKLQEFKR